MGQRNTGVGCRPGGSGDARHHLERDPRLGGSLQLFCAAAKNKRIAALQSHDGFPRLRRLHQQLIGFMLRHRVLAGAFANANKFGIATHQLENRLSHQMIVENHVRLLDRLQTAKGQQPGIARPGADQNNFSRLAFGFVELILQRFFRLRRVARHHQAGEAAGKDALPEAATRFGSRQAGFQMVAPVAC